MIGWLDCASGVSGDMLLGTLVDVGVPLAVLQDAVDAVLPGAVALRVDRVTRAGLAATRVHVDDAVTGRPADDGDVTTTRTWRDVHDLLSSTPFAGRPVALTAFGALAAAEAEVHGTTLADVHFHEVGAVDAIADIVGVAAGFAYLGLDQVVASPVAVGAGTVRTAHGVLPVPVPAVVTLLRGRPTYGGGAEVELATPTGAALLTALCVESGAQPPMSVDRCGTGAGGRDRAGAPNVLRLLVGETVAPTDGECVVEATVDDLDPRVWPGVLQALLAAGADDAWLVPVLMKKGRPAHVVHVLVPERRMAAARQVLFAQTTTLGVRSHRVDRVVLQREVVSVDVDGEPVRVKLGLDDGRVVNAQPEWDDVAAAAERSGQPAKVVLARAVAAYWDIAREGRPVAGGREWT